NLQLLHQCAQLLITIIAWHQVCYARRTPHIPHYLRNKSDTRHGHTLASRASMPLLETAPMDERERFIADHRLDLYTMTELCRRYHVSRKTGYKWIDRMEEGGRAALRDRSRAPHHCPHRIAANVAEW